MFSLIERCSRDVSCVTTEICARRLSSLTPAMSWPSIRMRPSCGSKKRRSRLTSVVLPTPERPTRPIFSPGRMVRSSPSMHRIAVAVAEADILEADLAARHVQRLRVGPVLHRERARDRLHALLHRAHILEDAHDLEGDPARHGDDLRGEQKRRGHGAGIDAVRAEQPHRHGAGRHQEHRVDEGERRRRRPCSPAAGS